MTDNQNPLSPHLQIYRWHISSLLSITHRISGVINLLALILIFFWLIALSLGEIFEDYIHNKKIKDVANILTLISSIIIPIIVLILLIFKV